MKDYYRILSLPENASDQEIKLAYRRLAKRYHPDVNAGAKGAEERFKEIVEAYDTLSDPILRAAYDRKRLRESVYRADAFFYQPEKKKDPHRKEYSPEDFERARRFREGRIMQQMRKRKKLLMGMIVTFVLYLCATAAFEAWIAQKRKEADRDSRSIATVHVNDGKEQPMQNLESPYDKLFGTYPASWLSPNEFVVYNPLSDAVICLVESDPPYRTVRNEFVQASSAFSLRELPDGTYEFKVYTGSNWNRMKSIPGGERLGGFLKDEEFFRITDGPFRLEHPTKEKGKTNYSDTIVIDPTKMHFERITREEFFNAGDSLK